MKTLLYILFAVFSTSLIAQTPSGPIYTPVLDFVDNHLGEKVGRGVCFDLIEKAFKANEKKWLKNKWDHKSRYKVAQKDIQAGDVALFHSCKFSDGSSTGYHIAFIYSVDNDSIITIAEQNVCERSQIKIIKYHGQRIRYCNNSSVGISEINLAALVKGRMTFYRF